MGSTLHQQASFVSSFDDPLLWAQEQASFVPNFDDHHLWAQLQASSVSSFDEPQMKKVTAEKPGKKPASRKMADQPPEKRAHIRELARLAAKRSRKNRKEAYEKKCLESEQLEARNKVLRHELKRLTPVRDKLLSQVLSEVLLNFSSI